MPLITVDSVFADHNYQLYIKFSTGKYKRFNFTPMFEKYKMYHAIKNPGLFQMAYADGISVTWSDEIDIHPLTLYENSVPCDVSQFPTTHESRGK